MIAGLIRGIATLASLTLVVASVGAFALGGDSGLLSTEAVVSNTGVDAEQQRLSLELVSSEADAPTVAAESTSVPASNPSAQTSTATPSPSTSAASAAPIDQQVTPTPTTPATAAPVAGAPKPATPPPPPAATTTTTTTTTTVAPPPAVSGSGMALWDTAWQVAAKANDAGMQQYVNRLSAAKGSTGANVTGFLFSVVNINQDINTANGFGNSFGSFSEPNPAYLNNVETLIAKAAGRGLRVAIVVGWDGPEQYSVESGKLNADNAYQYGYTIASQWTRPDFGSRWAISAWVMGGDTTRDNGGEHGAVWAEVVRGIEDAEAANGFGKATILHHTAPGQQMHYVGASWLDAHSPQTGHCADTNTAVDRINQLHNSGARIWGNAEMRYEDITWSCNGNNPISPDQVLADAIAMANLGYMDNFVYGHDDRWNSGWPGANGLDSGGAVSPGLQKILDHPGLIRSR